mmetsp:Transcript_15122/g.47504  ORF Transcript_15122/g.47504 Transcript_15122/m.47504 type:complete len:220 (-) Transcript_15122:433-1092(-)
MRERRTATGWSFMECPKTMGSMMFPMTAWMRTRPARARTAVFVVEFGPKTQTGAGSATATSAPRLGTKLVKKETTPKASQRSTERAARRAAVRRPTRRERASLPLMYELICRSTRREKAVRKVASEGERRSGVETMTSSSSSTTEGVRSRYIVKRTTSMVVESIERRPSPNPQTTEVITLESSSFSATFSSVSGCRHRSSMCASRRWSELTMRSRTCSA